MKIVVLDGYTENPGDLSWGALEALGELTVYDRTPLDNEEEIAARIGGCPWHSLPVSAFACGNIGPCWRLLAFGICLWQCLFAPASCPVWAAFQRLSNSSRPPWPYRREGTVCRAGGRVPSSK